MTSSVRLLPVAALVALVIASAFTPPAAPATTPQPPAPAGGATPARPATPASPPVATVGGRDVSRDEFERRSSAALDQYRQRSGSEVPDDFKAVIRRQVLEGQIRHELLVLEAKRRGMTGTEAEADGIVRKDPYFNPNGQFDPQRYAAIRSEHPQAYQAAIGKVREQLGARDLEQKVENDFMPSPDQAATRASRSLSTAHTNALVLRLVDFNGNYAEPTEAQMLAYYRGNAESFRRPERVVVSFITMPSDAPDSLDAASARALKDRQKRSADSLLAALRRGADFAAAGETFGGVRDHIVITRDNYPGFWQGSAADRQALFATAPGSLLPAPVASDFGWLLIRVDDKRPSAIAPIAEVAREIRTRLRMEARQNAEDRELRALYAQMRDTLAGPAYKVRYAVVDTGRMALVKPTHDDLQRYYEGHLADYSYFDTKTGAIKNRPFEEVRADIEQSWVHQQRVSRSRGTIEVIQRAWLANQRDRDAERSATTLREVGPLPVGAIVDTGGVSAALTDSVWSKPGMLRVGTGEFGRGLFVFHVYAVVPNVTPTYEQSIPVLRARRDVLRTADADRGARALYDQDPMRFAEGVQIHYTRVRVPRTALLETPLTREEVERYYQAHIDKYTAPEQVSARHILFQPTDAGADADSAARQRALAALARIRAGEDFADLARQLSDDAETRADGGDLGVFGRGAMLPEFERTAFAMKPGQVSEPVRTQSGWHLIKVMTHEPAAGHPLATIYTNVGAELATEKAGNASKRTADSLYRTRTTPAALKTVARKLKFEVTPLHYTVGDTRMTREMAPVLEKIRQLKVGEFYPGTFESSRGGWCLAVIDSITPPRKPEWYQAQAKALDAYHAGAGRRALDAKRAELDSMSRAGWSLDSLGTLWGGLMEYRHQRGAPGIAGIGGGAVLDSVLLGTATHAAVISPGQASDWLVFPLGAVRLEFVEQTSADAAQVSNRAQNERRIEYERKLYDWYADLKKRYPVKILDPKLAAIPLPEPPPASR